MKSLNALSLAAAVALLALGGAAIAQNGSTSSAVGGVNNQAPPANASAAEFPTPYSKASVEEVYQQKLKAYDMACTVDREALCKGRSSASAVWACIRIHRSKLAEPCRAATFAVERASADANHSS